MKKNRLIAFALSVSLLLGASACGKPAKNRLRADSGGKRHPRPAPGTVDNGSEFARQGQSVAEHPEHQLR